MEKDGNTEPLLRDNLDDEHIVARVIIEDVDGMAQTRIVLGSHKGATSFSSVFTLCNSCIGAGVLSLPYAFRKAGNTLRAFTHKPSHSLHTMPCHATCWLSIFVAQFR